MYRTLHATTERIAGQDEIESAKESLIGLYDELVGLDDPEDYEPSERDYDYLDA
jgi:hypothetical protein